MDFFLTRDPLFALSSVQQDGLPTLGSRCAALATLAHFPNHYIYKPFYFMKYYAGIAVEVHFFCNVLSFVASYLCKGILWQSELCAM